MHRNKATMPIIFIFLADALLADLQNNVPGQGHKTLPSKTAAHVTFAEQQNSSSPGYGSLNGVKKPITTSTVSELIKSQHNLPVAKLMMKRTRLP